MTEPDSPGLFDEPAQTGAMAPLHVIRTETVLSKLPIHNLAKKGKVDIRLFRKGQGGDVQLKWEVSHNERYGQPRQLAYKLDTLIVNRRLDEASRPLPTIIRIGSLKEICRDLGLAESGKTNKDLRIALLQNASAFINAQFTYRAADGSERRLEAAFTRYGVVFTGERLPDGRLADCVYIVLNQPYWEVVNHAPVRPLDYDYLKALTPGAQRFYEIVSFRIFAALKYNRPTARILYSDYCAYSAQQRYYDQEHFRIQMYKLHKPHLDAGYLRSVSVVAAQDGEGKSDWWLVYTPGPKARAEFDAFAGRQRAAGAPFDDAADEDDAASPGLAALPPFGATAPGTPTLLDELTRRGIATRAAERLLASHPHPDDIFDQLEWGDHLVRSASPPLRNPPGFYVALIRDRVPPPPGFATSRRLHAEQQSLNFAEEESLRRQQQTEAYEQFVQAEIDRALAALPADEHRARLAAKRRHYSRQFPNLFAETLDHLAQQGVRSDLRESLPLPSLDTFIEISGR